LALIKGNRIMAENRIVGIGDGTQKLLEKPGSVLAPAGLVSILVPCCGMLEYTKLCVPSLLRHSRLPFELIFIDIGSLDGTAEYLAGVGAAAQVRIEVVRTPTDMGIPDACKEALAQAGGEYVVLLNNDTVVTDSWLQQLIGLAGLSPAIGLVGPMSNYAAPPQLVETVPYRLGPRKRGLRSTESVTLGQEVLLDTSAVDQFAREFRDKQRGKWLETERLGGFCLFMKREVLQRIGNKLDQWTDLGLFDTDIVSAKAREAGFTLAVCRDLFIHHFGTRTFAHGAPAATKDGKSLELQPR
jgi:O-antigen biosynthesis protein